MLSVFEVFLAPGANAEKLLTDETTRETNAQVMTVDDARKVGFGGIPDDPEGRDRRLIAVNARDARWIQRALEANDAVASFRVHEVD